MRSGRDPYSSGAGLKAVARESTAGPAAALTLWHQMAKASGAQCLSQPDPFQGQTWRRDRAAPCGMSWQLHGLEARGLGKGGPSSQAGERCRPWAESGIGR